MVYSATLVKSKKRSSFQFKAKVITALVVINEFEKLYCYFCNFRHCTD